MDNFLPAFFGLLSLPACKLYYLLGGILVEFAVEKLKNLELWVCQVFPVYSRQQPGWAAVEHLGDGQEIVHFNAGVGVYKKLLQEVAAQASLKRNRARRKTEFIDPLTDSLSQVHAETSIHMAPI